MDSKHHLCDTCMSELDHDIRVYIKSYWCHRCKDLFCKHLKHGNYCIACLEDIDDMVYLESLK